MIIFRREDFPHTRKDFLADVIAGVTVAIVALPLAIGFGITSGLSATAGIDLIWGIISGVATYFVLKWTHRLGR